MLSFIFISSQCKISERLSYAELCDDPHTKCDINRVICYSYAYIPLRSNLVLPASGSHEFFTFVVPIEPPVIADFELRLVSAKSSRVEVRPAIREDFYLRRSKDNEVKLAVLHSLKGPQDIELEIICKMYKNGLQIGKNVASVTLFVSEYDY